MVWKLNQYQNYLQWFNKTDIYVGVNLLKKVLQKKGGGSCQIKYYFEFKKSILILFGLKSIWKIVMMAKKDRRFLLKKKFQAGKLGSGLYFLESCN